MRVPLLEDTFRDGLDSRWRILPEDAAVRIAEDGCRIQGENTGLFVCPGKPEWRNYTAEAEISIEALERGGFAGIAGRVSNDGKYGYRFGFAGDGRVILEKNVDGWNRLQEATQEWEAGRRLLLSLSMETIPEGTLLSASIDGRRVFCLKDADISYRNIPYGGAGLLCLQAEMTAGRFAVYGEESRIPARGVLVYKDYLSLLPGEKARLSAVVWPGEATNRNIIWKSSDPCVASVDADGLLTAVGYGTAEISAISEDAPSLRDVCHLTVRRECSRFLYLSPDGNDENPGTLEAPFRTLERARRAVREIRQNGIPEGGITVFLMGGIYRRSETFCLGPQDSGEWGREIVYRSLPGQEVRVCGSVPADGKAFRAVTDPAVLSRLRPEAVGHVMELDLKAQGITEYGELLPRGLGQDMRPVQMEVFLDGEPYDLARYPNQGFCSVGRVIDGRKGPGAVFCYTDDRSDGWTKAEDLWLYGYLENAYADSHVGVSKVDPDQKTFTLRQGTMYGVKEVPPFGGKHNKYCAYNLLEEIDIPGEYYLDRSKGVLYIWPRHPVGEGTQIELSALEAPLVALEGCANVRLESLIFENSRGMGIYEEDGANVLIRSCEFRNLGTLAVVMGRGACNAWKEQADRSEEAILRSRAIGDIKGYMWHHPDADRHPGRNIGIYGCHMHDLGCGGVILDGGSRKRLAYGRCYIEDCEVHHVNRIEKAYRGGVRFMGAGNLAAHNRFLYADHMTIDLMGNDNLIEYNEIGYSASQCGDMGAIYHGVDPTYFGNVIRYNHIHDTGAGGHVHDIYNDGRGDGLTVEGNYIGNICTRRGAASVFINGGQFNVIRGNRWYHTPFPYVFPPRWYNGVEFREEILGECQNWIVRMDIAGPLWREKYPALARFAKIETDLPYSPLNNIYEDSRMYDSFEEMCQDRDFDQKRFAFIGRYPEDREDKTAPDLQENGQRDSAGREFPGTGRKGE